ncbi:MAG: hypothetical protein K6D97_02375 [Clostridia bacterium]|nr:hypothetical protein [Clostridia bacterium]
MNDYSMITEKIEIENAKEKYKEICKRLEENSDSRRKALKEKLELRLNKTEELILDIEKISDLMREITEYDDNVKVNKLVK